MTDPLIELARKSVPPEWCRNDIVINAAVNALRTQQAMIVEWLNKEAELCDCNAHEIGECACGAWYDDKTVPVSRIAENIEQSTYLKERG